MFSARPLGHQSPIAGPREGHSWLVPPGQTLVASGVWPRVKPDSCAGWSLPPGAAVQAWDAAQGCALWGRGGGGVCALSYI